MKATTDPPVLTTERLPEIHELPLASRHQFSLHVAGMADGTNLSLPVNFMIGGKPGPCLLLVAGIHGNEYEGITAQLELWDEFKPEEITGTVMMVPVANPPAFRHKQRRNPEDMLDMNRAFPGKADGTITEQLAYCLFHSVAIRADMVLSMHSWMQGALVLPYTEYPRDSAVTVCSRAAAVAFGLNYIEAHSWPPGLLVAVCARAGIPAIEPEIGGLANTLPEYRALYKQGTRALLRHLGMLPASGLANGSERSPVQEVTRQELHAPVGGILRRYKELGDPVGPGTSVATISNLNGQELADLTAPVEGFIAAQIQAAAVDAGELVAVVFALKES